MRTTNEQVIVVGVDESPQSVAALEWAAAQAARSGARLRLVHAWDVGPSDMYGPTFALRETIVQDARARLTKMITDTLGSGTGPAWWRLDLVRGPAGPVLVDASSEAGLLVLGTGEHAGVRRLLAGSVSHYCLSHATAPVVAVPVRPQVEARASASTAQELQPAGALR